MTAYADPFATAPAPEPAATTQPAPASAPNPYKIGFTLKAAPGYEAEWLTPTVYGASAQETAERGRDLLVAMQEAGLIDLATKAAEYTRAQYKGQAKPAAQNSNKPTQQPTGEGPLCKCGNPSAYTEWGTNKFNPSQPNRAYKCAIKVADYRDPSGCDFIKWVR
ncbi:hypothetical protein [Streptomyces cacaoi]|uniref:hypothetical protein n=1 Tax=Streptomyces cacaoi TaxID=1898 RepID=UPI001142E821|nr:hypothetical protein [Streptomyces cacaoi]